MGECPPPATRYNAGQLKSVGDAMQVVWAWLAPYASVIVGVVAAFVFSVGIGGFVVPCFHAGQAKNLPDVDEPNPLKRVHPNLTGTIERAAFTLFTIVSPVVALPMMLAW